MPSAYCDALDSSTPGEYPIYLEGGHSNNYDLKLAPGILTINTPSGISTVTDSQNAEIDVFDLNGVKIFSGLYSEAKLSEGFYIIVTKDKAFKVYVK